jgi:hypothetical protein
MIVARKTVQAANSKALTEIAEELDELEMLAEALTPEPSREEVGPKK